MQQRCSGNKILYSNHEEFNTRYNTIQGKSMIILLSHCSQCSKTELSQHLRQPMSINMLINVYGSEIIFISYIHFKYKRDRQTTPHTDLRVLLSSLFCSVCQQSFDRTPSTYQHAHKRHLMFMVFYHGGALRCFCSF